jgi:hypothetical protein
MASWGPGVVIPMFPCLGDIAFSSLCERVIVFEALKLGSSVAARSAEFFSFQCQIKYIVAKPPPPPPTPSARNHPCKMRWRIFFYRNKINIFLSFSSCKIKPRKKNKKCFSVSLHARLSLAKKIKNVSQFLFHARLSLAKWAREFFNEKNNKNS